MDDFSGAMPFMLGLTFAPIALLLVVVLFFIHNFITMNPSPFKAMQAIYVYAAAFVGLILVSLGLYSVLEILLDVLLAPATEFAQNGVVLNTGDFVTPLTQLIVGTFIMVPHWAVGHHFHLRDLGKK